MFKTDSARFCWKTQFVWKVAFIFVKKYISLTTIYFPLFYFSHSLWQSSLRAFFRDISEQNLIFFKKNNTNFLTMSNLLMSCIMRNQIQMYV